MWAASRDIIDHSIESFCRLLGLKLTKNQLELLRVMTYNTELHLEGTVDEMSDLYDNLIGSPYVSEYTATRGREIHRIENGDMPLVLRGRPYFTGTIELRRGGTLLLRGV